MKNALLVLILSSCLAGCGSTPATVEYYRISSEPPQQAPSTPSVDAKTVVLEQVELATFLSQPGLVMQSGDNTIVISKVHLWAERLDKALPRLLTTRLQQQSGRYHFFRGHADWADDPDYSLRVRIDNFQPNTNGEAYARCRRHQPRATVRVGQLPTAGQTVRPVDHAAGVPVCPGHAARRLRRGGSATGFPDQRHRG